MNSNYNKSYLFYLNKLVDQYNNTSNYSINKIPAFTEKIETNSKVSKFKVNDRVRITKYKSIFSKDYTGNWLREIVVIESVLKTNYWTYKLKDLNEEKLIGSFHEK